MLNPFFIQGTKGEQSLLQEITNEHLRMYGVECVYLPRIFVNTKTILQEISSSTFNQSFPIEAYIENYEGYGDNLVLSKFGVRTTSEATFVISRERFLNYITPLMEGVENSQLTTRPKEGDLIYFPLSDTLFEIKYVIDKEPFYQLQKQYIYKLKCEIFEYEDEIIQTGITEIDDEFSTETTGYNATLVVLGIGKTAQAYTSLVDGGVNKITVINSGTGYISTPLVKIESPVGIGRTAKAVAITTSNNTGSRSLQKIIISDPGFGYTFTPAIQIIPSDGKGSGASAIAGIGTTGAVGIVTISLSGQNYAIAPNVTFESAPAGGFTAIGTATINANGNLSSINLINAGYGYTVSPVITVSSASTIGIGTYNYGDIITGKSTLTTAFVLSWSKSDLTLKVNQLTGRFAPGEVIVGASKTNGETIGYTLNTINYDDDDAYEQNQELRFESNSIIDFTERNPFGEV
jgi:hypothetical protein